MDIAGFYEQIPHDDLISAIDEMLSRTFMNQRKQYIQVQWLKREAKLVSSKPAHDGRATRTFSHREIIDLIRLKIKNNYLQIGDKVGLKKKKGIDMGANDSPKLSVLFAFSLERKFMLDLAARDRKLAKKFNCCVRNIDDLCFLRFPEGPSFASQIYPTRWFEVTIDQGLVNGELNFLDLCIFKGEDGLSAWLHWSKTENFNFTVVSFPHALSWLPENNKAPALVGRVVHFSRTNRYYVDFIRSIAILYLKLTEQNGWKMEKIMRILERCEVTYGMEGLRKNVATMI